MNKNRVQNQFSGVQIDSRPSKEGKIGWALLWMMGVPIPLLLVFFLLRGCT